MEDDKWHPYNRRSLLQELQDILREYHDEIQILHELIQNAEDCGASVIKIIHDPRQIDPGGHFGHFFKSPALCVYNNSVFDEDDWKGITSIGLSHKEDKVEKIGRYGMGFKSIFHLTDYPVVISGDSVLLIDPFKVGREWRKSELMEMEDLFKQSGVNDIPDFRKNAGSFYKGTLFWFPLRHKESDLSKKTWTTTTIQQVLRSFQEDLHLLLMFLKHVECIELHTMIGDNHLLERVKIKYPDDKREHLIRMYLDILEKKRNGFRLVENVEIEITNSKNECQNQMCTIAHYYPTDTEMSDRLARLAADDDVSCLPYVAIAFQHESHSNSNGRVFNFLPLPMSNSTNLPVHVNANFALSQNRRNLQLSDGRVNDNCSEWNKLIAEELLTKAYINLVQQLIQNSVTFQNTSRKEQVQLVYECFPQGEINLYNNIWGNLVRRFYEEIQDKPFFYSCLRNGVWVNKETVVLCTIEKLTGYESKEVIMIEKAIKDVLLNLGKEVFEPYKKVDYLLQHVNLNHVSQQQVISLLKAMPQVYKKIQTSCKVKLLQFLIQGNHDDLNTLELIPSYNGDFMAFSSEGESIYICKTEDVQIFHGMEHRFVRTDLPEPLFKDLQHLADDGLFQLRMLQVEDLPEILLPVFHRWESRQYTPNTGQICKKWIKALWQFIYSLQPFPIDLKVLENLPLIPQFNKDGTITKLYNLNGNYIVEGKNDTPLSAEIKNICGNGGIQVLAPNDIIESYIMGRSNYVKSPSLSCIMELLGDQPDLKIQLQAHVGDGDLWVPIHTTARSFGQGEELVTRLKGIISTYPEEHSVLKEILQNADDAGASVIHFLYDTRNHKTSSIFNEQWKHLQGPSLCVYNDACFTDTDLEGIKKLGIGSKAEHYTKTGQFGLGFNAVYHLTDAPMILSIGNEAALGGGMFCVLDPHCRYAPKADVYGPGMVMELMELQDKYQDVFDTFLTSTGLTYEKGTWFRLPLRSLDAAKTSQIKQNPCSHDNINKLLKQMVSDIKEGLFSKVNISVVDSDGERYLCRVTLLRDELSFKQHQNFKQRLLAYNALWKTEKIDVKSFSAEVFESLVDISDEVDNSASKWVVFETLGFSNTQQLDPSLRGAIERRDIQICPRGGVALQISKAQLNDNSTKKLTMPRAFCLLPLEIETGLTGHINGQFAVDMSRSTLMGSDLEYPKDMLGRWNLNLIRWNIAYAYARCLYYLRDYLCPTPQTSANLNQYLDLFPLFCEAKNDFWKELVYHLFLHLKSYEMFPIVPDWYASDEIIFGTKDEKVRWVSRHDSFKTEVLVDNLSEKNIDQSNAQELRYTLVKLGMKLICIPRNICTSALESCTYHHNKQKRLKSGFRISSRLTKHEEQVCVCIETLSPMKAIEFFKSYQSNKQDKFIMSSIRPDEVKICLKYCLTVENWDYVYQLPLLLSESGQKTNFKNVKSNDSLIYSEFFFLLPGSSERFIHNSLLDILEPYSNKFLSLTLTMFAEYLPKSMPLKRRPYLSKKLEATDNDLMGATETDIKWCTGFWKFIDDTCHVSEDELIESFKSVEQLNDWCLLPVTLNSSMFLFPLSWCQYTVIIDSFRKCPELRETLAELNLPVPYVESRVLSSLVATHDNSQNLLSCLYFWRKKINCLSLDNKQCLTMLMYLIRDIESSQRKNISKLKELKLFTSINGDRICLTYNTLFVFEGHDVPLNGLDELFKKTKKTVIKGFKEPWATNLLKVLGCKPINVVKLYTICILPELKLLTNYDVMIHLEFVRDRLMRNDTFKYQLSGFYLIPIGYDGGLRKGSEFYDPHHRLFAIMCEKPELPPYPFCQLDWFEFMDFAGMKTKIKAEILLNFAYRISSSAPNELNKQKSNALVKEFVEYVNRETVSNKFLSEISKIPFIVIDTDNSKYEEIHKPFESGPRLVCYNGSLSSSNQNIAWTTATVLPDYAMPNKNICSVLKIQEEAPFNIVEQHTHNLCSKLQTTCKNHDQNFIEEIMADIYEYFTTTTDASVLKTIPMVHHCKHMIFLRADQIVGNLSEEEEIPPYLLKAPVNYGKFFELFSKLGMWDRQTTDTYCNVLNNIFKDTEDRCLDVSSLECTRLATRGLMKCLQSLENPLENIAIETLYLLSEENKLKRSTSLHYESFEMPKDDFKHVDGLNFMADLQCIGLNVAQLESLFQRLPVEHRPVSAASLFNIKVELEENVDNDKAMPLQQYLTSDIFITSVLRIIKCDQPKNSEMTDDFMKSISATLRRLRVNVVKKLLIHYEKEGTCYKSATQERACFVDESKTILYINDTDLAIDQWLQTFDIELERAIRLLCQENFNIGSLVIILGQIPQKPDDLSERLTKLGKPFIEDEVLKKIWFPLPGSLVPRDLIEFCRKPSSLISVQQYAVIKQSDVESKCTPDIDNSDEPIYIYCIVTGYESEENTYNVNAGKGFDIKVRKDHIYEIRQTRTDNGNRNDGECILPGPEFDAYETASFARDFHASGKPNPQKQEGRRWLEQAHWDLTTGKATIKGINNFIEEVRGYNWVCLMCQQAAEKAMKGAQYATDANKVYLTHNLYDNIPSGDGCLVDMAGELINVVNDINRLRYPSFDKIPADMFSEQDAKHALDITTKILSHVTCVYFSDVENNVD